MEAADKNGEDHEQSRAQTSVLFILTVFHVCGSCTKQPAQEKRLSRPSSLNCPTESKGKTRLGQDIVWEIDTLDGLLVRS